MLGRTAGSRTLCSVKHLWSSIVGSLEMQEALFQWYEYWATTRIYCDVANPLAVGDSSSPFLPAFCCGVNQEGFFFFFEKHHFYVGFVYLKIGSDFNSPVY